MMNQSTQNVIAIVGRPNVGKSSLFNRILRKRVAIVEKHAGTTRDRLGQKGDWGGVPFELVDTGGIVTDPEEELGKMVKLQAEVAISEASVVLFVVDVSEGLTPLDMEIAAILRKAGASSGGGRSRGDEKLLDVDRERSGEVAAAGKKVIVVVNKCDNPQRLQLAAEFYALGFEKVFGVSALHGLGIADMLEEAVSNLPGEAPSETGAALRAAIVGQPNVGKSTFINFLLGEERLIVHDAPGTTRDSIDVPYETEDGEKILFIDTAGIRRRRDMSRPIEKLSSLRAERSVGRCDVAMLLIDAPKGPTTGDSRIAHIIQESHKGCVLVVNKWDLVQEVSKDEFEAAVYQKLPFLAYCPVVFSVATSGKGVMKALDAAREVHRESMKRVPTPVLNDILHKAVEHRPAPLMRFGGGRARGNRLKVYYATQTGVSPPRFRLFANKARLAKPDYLAYLTNRIRSRFAFPGSPILLELRDRG